MAKIEVGQVLWFQPRDPRSPGREVTVAKIGRKWATTEGRMQIDKETLEVDGGAYASPGRCWPSRAAYERAERLRRLWALLKERMRATGSAPPEGVIEHDVRTAAAVLRIDLGDE